MVRIDNETRTAAHGFGPTFTDELGTVVITAVSGALMRCESSAKTYSNFRPPPCLGDAQKQFPLNETDIAGA